MTEADRLLMRELLAEVRLLRGELSRRRENHADPAQDGRLLLALAQSAGDAAFTVADALRHAAVDPALKRVLVAAGLTTARTLGAALRRLRRAAIDGCALEVIGRERDGALWRLYVATVGRTVADRRRGSENDGGGSR